MEESFEIAKLKGTDKIEYLLKHDPPKKVEALREHILQECARQDFTIGDFDVLIASLEIIRNFKTEEIYRQKI